MRNISLKLFQFEPVVQEMLLKYIYYLQLWWPLCSAKWDHLCNFGRGHSVEHFCKIILNSDQWFSRNHLQDVLARALEALMFGGVEPLMQFC